MKIRCKGRQLNVVSVFTTTLDLMGFSAVCMLFLWAWELLSCLHVLPARGLSEDAVYNPVHYKRYLFFLWGLAALGVFHSCSSIPALGFSDLTNLSAVLILSKAPLGHWTLVPFLLHLLSFLTLCFPSLRK